jgi:hypothetical protein
MEVILAAKAAGGWILQQNFATKIIVTSRKIIGTV